MIAQAGATLITRGTIPEHTYILFIIISVPERYFYLLTYLPTNDALLLMFLVVPLCFGNNSLHNILKSIKCWCTISIQHSHSWPLIA